MKLFSILALMLIFVLTAQAVSNFDLTFNFGPSLAQSGAISDLGSPNINTGLGFNYFFRPNHGLGFTYNNEFDFDGSSKFKTIDNASISTFDLHYAYRYMKGKFQFLFEPGIGWQTVYEQTQDYYWGYFYMDDLTTSFVFDYKLLARYVVKEWQSGEMTSSGSFFVGGGIIQTFSFSDELNGKDISGNRLALLFQVGVGW
jgi:hypothetical protein